MILVTGGSGLVGTHLLLELLRRKRTGIRAVTRNLKSANRLQMVAGFYADITQADIDSIEWVQADVVNSATLYSAFENVTEVYHCAAAVSFDSRQQSLINETNVSGTANVVNLSLEFGISKFCHVSSIAAIGSSVTSNLRTESDEWDVGKQRSFYSRSKYFAEMEVWRGIAEGLPATIINPSVIVGPGVWGESSTAIFKRVWNGMRYYTMGGTGFVDVRDVACIMVDLMDKQVWGERFIVNSENINYFTFIKTIAESLNKTTKLKALPSVLASAFWRIDACISYVTGSSPRFTKENKRTSFSTSKYSNDKITAELAYSFIPIVKSIGDTARLFLESK